jgi:16S rRNA (uracil1498-N3)-methyltransferase
MIQPYFFVPVPSSSQTTLTLDEDSSKHILQVLRMQPGEQLRLTDGRGALLHAQITGAERKKCTVKIIDSEQVPREARRITIGISLLKNNNRFEWFLEKATEMGISEVVPLVCERTEKQHLRIERMRAVLQSAMLQSQQVWMPELSEPKGFPEALAGFNHQQKFIAHCVDEKKRNLSDLVNPALQSQVILVGPEGDFSRQEIELAARSQYIPVSLGPSRLRTETAGLVAAALLRFL